MKEQDHTLSLSTYKILSLIIVFVSYSIPDWAVASRMRLHKSFDDILVTLGKHELFKALYSWPQLLDLGDINVRCWKIMRSQPGIYFV
jgi:hypothetical protein